MSIEKTYPHLEPRPCSAYRQPYVKGTRIRVEIPYSDTIDKVEDDGEVWPGRTPEEIAADYCIPVAAVLEAIDWCGKHWDVVVADHSREERLIEAHGMNHPEYKNDPKKYYKELTLEKLTQILNDEALPG